MSIQTVVSAVIEKDDSSSSSSITSATDSDTTIDIPVVYQCKESEVDLFVTIAFEPNDKGHIYYYVGNIRRQEEYDVKKIACQCRLIYISSDTRYIQN